jgi:hypothetical protein
MSRRLVISARLAALVAISLLFPALTQAQWSLNGVPLAGPPQLQYWPDTHVLSDGAGGAIVTWSYGDVSPQVFAERVDVDGRPTWAAGAVQLSATAIGGSGSTCATDGHGGAVVFWSAPGGAYGQRLDASGAARWGSVAPLVMPDTASTTVLAAAEDGAAGAYVLRDLYANQHSTAWLQHVDSTGVAIWAGEGIQVGSYTTVLASDGHGGVLVALNDGSGARVQRFSADGTAQWGAAGVLVFQPYSWISGLAGDGAGGAFVAGTNAPTVYAQHVNAGGVPVWPSALSVSPPLEDFRGDSRMYAVIVPDAAQGAIVAWRDARGLPRELPGNVSYNFPLGVVGDIYAQRVDASGALRWLPGGVPVCTARLGQDSPTMVADGVGGAIIAWQDDRTGQLILGEPSNNYYSFSPNQDVYAQRLDSSGSPQWAQNGLSLCTAPQQQVPVGIVSDGLGGAIVVWNDYRASASLDYLLQPYAQHVPASGVAPYIVDVAPALTSVRDVPNDQGGHVFLTWLGSSLDVPGERYITEYAVWRRVPGALATARVDRARADGTNIPSGVRVIKRARPDGTSDLTYWEQVASLRAEQLPGYGYMAATAQDSIAGSNPYTAFFVTALTADPFEFYESAPDSGYSVDNLAPPAPTPFTASYLDGATWLHWGLDTAPDFAGFRLYRGVSPDFAPSSAALIVAKADTGYVDAGLPGQYYKLTAIDAHGNESPCARLGPAQIAGVPGSGLPEACWLAPVAPNPMRDELRLNFALPQSGPAALAVFDASGRRVRTVLDQTLAAGGHSVSWDGRNELGQPVAAGLYFAKLTTVARTLTARVAVIR